MKEGVDWLAPSAFTSPITATYTRDIISNVPAVKYYEQTRCFLRVLYYIFNYRLRVNI